MSVAPSSVRSSNSTVLGPYADSDALDLDAVRNKQLELECVAFEQNGSLIGLDFIEDKIRRDEGEVFFHGKWLVDKKLLSAWMHRELEQRHAPRATNSKLILILTGTLYMHPFFQKIKANDKKINFPIQFVSCPRASSRTSRITYKISSLSTAQLRFHSLKFFDRNRVLYLIDKAIAFDTRFPTAHRNPAWLLQTYANMFDSTSGSDNENRDTRQHALELLLANASWIEKELIKKRDLLDKDSWIKFARMVRQGKGRSVDALGSLATVSDGDSAEEADTREIDTSLEPMLGLNRTYITKNVSSERDKKRHKRNKPTFPSFLCEVPAFFPGRPWYCSIPGCHFAIDFRRGMSDDDLAILKPQEREWIRSHYSDVSDDRVVELLTDLVDMHKFRHLDDLGIGIFMITEKVDLYGEVEEERTLITKPRQAPIGAKLDYDWLKPLNHRPAFAHLHDSESD